LKVANIGALERARDAAALAENFSGAEALRNAIAVAKANLDATLSSLGASTVE